MKHYQQLLKETRHVKEVFDTLKESFYEAINYVEKKKEVEDTRRVTRTLVNYTGMTLEEAKDTDEALTALEMFREEGDNITRQRIFLGD